MLLPKPYSLLKTTPFTQLYPKDIDSFTSHDHQLLPNISAREQPNQSRRCALEPFHNVFYITNLPLFYQRETQTRQENQQPEILETSFQVQMDWNCYFNNPSLRMKLWRFRN
ncbi:hypothetical protein HanXRQr2_Chr01g0035441 [Helianthus annuus]|uniref:Uncharacterized protein n=1 Tax=Helianthus annuus TaxID=4232 RepID=A0A9K3JY48_HELAN|nr:hypothetical protein HanXRQr2_Chr01g0035441 [Helianthus annuus]